MKTCSIDGCEKAKRQRGQYCAMHTARIARHGDPNANKHDRSARVLSSTGYIQITRPDHPLREFATSAQMWEHRVVLYDTIGPGAHACHHCGNIVAWGAPPGMRQLVVDHLDSDRSNNDPDNLVASCTGCNVRRGAAGQPRHSRAATTRGAA